jgi:uncharacterized repeat protein (TIGR01451 family)
VLGATELQAGDFLVCRVFFNNTGSDNSTTAWINLSTPSHLVYDSDNSAIEGGMKIGPLNWEFSDVGLGDHSYDIVFSTSVNARDGEPMVVSAHLDYLDMFLNPMPSSSKLSIVTARKPAFSFSIGADDIEISRGQVFNYTVLFENSGSLDAKEVFVDVSLPWEVSYVGDSASSAGGTLVSWMNWSFTNVLGSRSFDITVKALSNLTDGLSFLSQASLFYSNSNGVWYPDETAMGSATVTLADMVLAETTDKLTAHGGDLVEYTLSISNTGQGTALAGWMNATIPNGTTFVSSLPACDSMDNFMCTWTLHDILPGTHELLLTVKVNNSIPSGFMVRNDASFSYTDTVGVVVGNLSSFASTLVHDGFLSISSHLETTTLTPNDVFEIGLSIENPSPQSSPFALLTVTFPPDVQYISDNASDIGGDRIADGRWEFLDIPQGTHSFWVVAKTSLYCTDGQLLEIGIQMNHTAKSGNSRSSIRDMIVLHVKSPVVTASVFGPQATYEMSDTPTIFVHISNTGSDSAQSVWANLSFPSTIRYISDTSPQVGSLTSSDPSILFTDFGPGSRTYIVRLGFDQGIVDRTEIDVWLFVNCTDGNGDLVGYSQERLNLIVVPTSEEAPLFTAELLVLFALIGIGLSLVASLSRESTKYSLLMFFLPLYTRLKRKQVLDNEIRGMIRGYVTANPGDHFNAVKFALDLGNGTLAHHLSVLERENIVKSVKDGKFRRLFPAGAKVRDGAYITKVERLILDVVRETPGITQKDIVKRLGLSQPAVSYHISKLKKSNKMDAERHGMSVRHYINDSSR